MSSVETWQEVADASDISENETLRVEAHGVPVCLYRLKNSVYATADTCTHGLASLADGFVDGENIECPLHQGLFHIPTGKAVGAPCTVDISVFPVKVVEGKVLVGTLDVA